jgi:hypothetical protein
VNAGEREIVLREEGEKKGSARRSVQWGCDYATALNFEVDPHCRRFGCGEPDFALQTLIAGRAAKTEHVRVVALRWHSSGSEVRLGLPVGL